MNIVDISYMINAVVIGHGVVGKATAHTFGIKDYFDLKGSTISLFDVALTKRYIFLCLPTPTVNNRCQTEDIEKIIKQILDYGGRQKIFIIRSTVIPGTCNRIMKNLGIDCVVHNPEFLTEKTWKYDAERPDVVVLGGINPIYLEDVGGMYQGRFKGAVDIFRTDPVTSEMIKYAVNTFYATKVVFANQIYDFCKNIDANYEMIKTVMYKRKWIGKNHLRIFDETNKRGAKGKCLKKDLDAFAEYTGSKLLKVVKEINNGL